MGPLARPRLHPCGPSGDDVEDDAHRTRATMMTAMPPTKMMTLSGIFWLCADVAALGLFRVVPKFLLSSRCQGCEVGLRRPEAAKALNFSRRDEGVAGGSCRRTC
jgi:hypothetical protein